MFSKGKNSRFFGSNAFAPVRHPPTNMSLAYTTVKSDDVELKKMESELQAAILTNGYISVEAVKGLVTYGIISCEKFHILGTKDNIPHSQLLLGTSSCNSCCWLGQLMAASIYPTSVGYMLYCIATLD